MTPRRRITSEKPLSRTLNTKSTGDILRSAREARGESLQDVSRAIKVRVSMLQSIEAGKFFGLTDPLYLKGFIRAYTLHVGLDENEVMPFFRREYDEQRHQQQKLAAPLAPIETKKSVVTPGKLVIGFLTVAILTLVTYSYNQYVSVALTPDLVLTSPQDESKSEMSQVEVSGKTDPDAQLTLNGQQVSLTPEGEFKLTVALAYGTNTLQLQAINKLGKITTIERTVVGPSRISQQTTEIAQNQPTPTPTVLAANEAVPMPEASGSAQQKDVAIEIEVGPSPAWLEVKGDGKQIFAGLMLPGSTQSFSAKDVLYVKSGNAGSTKVYLHGVDQGVMGGDEEVVEKTYRR